MGNPKLQQPGLIAILLTFLVGILGLAIAVWWILSQSATPVTQTNQLAVQKNNSSVLVEPEMIQPSNTNSTFVEPTPIPAPTATPTTNSSSTTTPDSPCPDAGACDGDAQVYCADEWSGTSIEASWKLDLVHCLYDEHSQDISTGCLESLECRQQLNEELLIACQEDKQQFCASTRPSPGSEPLVDCLGEHFADLSADCAAAWTQHDAAKPQ